MSRNADFTPSRGNYTSLTPFRYWCQKVLPLAYDDSLSYYELLCKVVDFLNKTMEDTETLNDDVTNLYTAYQQLQQWVNDYYESEDFEQAIDAGLDRMVEDGSMDEIMTPVITSQLPSLVNRLLPDEVEEQLPGVVASQIGLQVEDQLPSVVSTQIGGVVSNQLPNVVGTQIGAVVGNQLPGVVSTQIDGVVDDKIVNPVEDWLDANVGTGNAIDRTLSILGAGADAAFTGARIDTLDDVVGYEHISDVGSIITTDEPYAFNYITIIDNAKFSDMGSHTYKMLVIPVTTGDKYHVQAHKISIANVSADHFAVTYAFCAKYVGDPDTDTPQYLPTTYNTDAIVNNVVTVPEITIPIGQDYDETTGYLVVITANIEDPVYKITDVVARESEVNALKDDLTALNTFAGAISPNRLDVSGNNATGYGINITFHDGKVTLNGTTSASGTIKIGNIIPLTSSPLMFIGIPSGASSSTFGIRYIHGSTISDKYADWTIGAMTVGDTYEIYIKFANGYTFDNVTFELMATEEYTGEWVAYGDFVIEKTCQEIVDEVSNEFNDVTGYGKPNLFKNTIKSQTANGLTFTVNADKSVTVVGTSTALSAPSANVTLPRGKYVLSGCNDGGSQEWHIMLQRTSGTLIYQYSGIEKTFEVVDDTETLKLYVRVLSGKTIDTTFYPMIRPTSVYNSTYAAYGEYQIYKPIQQLIDYTQFNWSGKKMNVIGDSIVQGSYGNFVNVVRDILCLSEARNYGVGGSCLASSSADSQYPPAVLRYENMDLDAQIIIVHAGTNDYSAQIPLGADDSTDITTFNGALNVMMVGLRNMYPTALVIFDSILHRFNDSALTIPASQYRECIKNRCLANHMVFYDAYKYSGFNFVKDYYDHNLTDDGLHPNQAGANILGRKLAGFIRWN